MATKEQIKEYLRIRDNIDETVNSSLNNTPTNIILNDMIEKDLVELTLRIVQDKKQYLKIKLVYETAMNDYAKTVKNVKNCDTTIMASIVKNIVEKYELGSEAFIEEIYKYEVLARSRKNYVFTVIIPNEGFTYEQEESLWRFLKWLVNVDFIPCTCRICFLLEASLHAYEYAEIWKIKHYYKYWNLCKAATIEWIQVFEMRHRDEISSLCSKQCKIRK